MPEYTILQDWREYLKTFVALVIIGEGHCVDMPPFRLDLRRESFISVTVLQSYTV